MMHWRVGRHLPAIAAGILVLASTAAAQNQDTTARSTGLPKQVQWKFNFDAGLGAFGFGNSLYTQAHPDPSGNLGDDWIESYAKPALSAVYPLKTGSVYGAASVVGERTFAAPPSAVGEDASSFQVEDLYIGWRSGKALSIGDDALDVQVGRMPYKIGRGFLIQDGGSSHIAASTRSYFDSRYRHKSEPNNGASRSPPSFRFTCSCRVRVTRGDV